MHKRAFLCVLEAKILLLPLSIKKTCHSHSEEIESGVKTEEIKGKSTPSL